MNKIEFPIQLKQLLEDSDLQPHIQALANCVGEILADNKLSFFPNYTDHGIDHVNRVLKSEVELVPKVVWEGSSKTADPRLLCEADAAIIIGATLLHDIAMHLSPDGFRDLIAQDSRFQPLSWFKENHNGHLADRDWPGLWEDFVREVRRFSDGDLANIIGDESARIWKFSVLPDDVGKWEVNHFLIIGEFMGSTSVISTPQMRMRHQT
jgi:molecular chaperone HtpG